MKSQTPSKQRAVCREERDFTMGSTILTSPWSYGTILGSPAPTPPVQQWIAVRRRFQKFDENLSLTPLQYLDGVTKRKGVVSCLNRHYYNSSSASDHSFLIGSWAKGAAVRPPRDVDLYFVVPYQTYLRFQDHIWNRPSGLLQEVKGVLAKTYPDTDMSGDGQIVLVRFESYNVEVVPAIALTNGRYWICDAHDGGSYEETDPRAETGHIESVDQANNRNLRPLIRMLKAWQNCCSVPIKSFQLELLAADFLGNSPWRLRDFFWFDWITRCICRRADRAGSRGGGAVVERRAGLRIANRRVRAVGGAISGNLQRSRLRCESFGRRAARAPIQDPSGPFPPGVARHGAGVPRRIPDSIQGFDGADGCRAGGESHASGTVFQEGADKNRKRPLHVQG